MQKCRSFTSAAALQFMPNLAFSRIGAQRASQSRKSLQMLATEVLRPPQKMHQASVRQAV
jgi:hypothetical protein